MSHSPALRPLPLDVSLPMIGRLLGQSEAQTTEPYAQLAGDCLGESAERICDGIAAHILPGYSEGEHA